MMVILFSFFCGQLLIQFKNCGNRGEKLGTTVEIITHGCRLCTLGVKHKNDYRVLKSSVVKSIFLNCSKTISRFCHKHRRSLQVSFPKSQQHRTMEVLNYWKIDNNFKPCNACCETLKNLFQLGKGISQKQENFT